MLIILFLVSHSNFLFVPCGRLSWLPVSFLLRVKYTLSYHIVSYFAVYVDDIGKLFGAHLGTYNIVLYADDILLLAPSVTVLQRLLQACDEELNSIDVVVNIKKSSCMRIGSRHNKICAKITACGILIDLHTPN